MPNPFFESGPRPSSTVEPSPNMKELYKMLTQSNNPTQLFYNIAKNNPNMKPALDLLQNGYSPQQVFEQMCKQRGLNPQDVLSKLKS